MGDRADSVFSVGLYSYLTSKLLPAYCRIFQTTKEHKAGGKTVHNPNTWRQITLTIGVALLVVAANITKVIDYFQHQIP